MKSRLANKSIEINSERIVRLIIDKGLSRIEVHGGRAGNCNTKRI